MSSTKRSYKSRLIMLFKTEKLYLLKIDPNRVGLSVIRENFYINKPITITNNFRNENIVIKRDLNDPLVLLLCNILPSIKMSILDEPDETGVEGYIHT